MTQVTEKIMLKPYDVKVKARQYYDKGLLTAQHPDPEKRVCQNWLDDYRCAVSASYPDDWKDTTKARIFEQGILQGYIGVEHPQNIGIISRIQQAHDFWAASRKAGNESTSQEVQDYLEMLFLSTIDYYTKGLEVRDRIIASKSRK